ncbi:MAG: ATP-dependent Clp protease proteolytic subunit [Pseudomonadota bacterium]
MPVSPFTLDDDDKKDDEKDASPGLEKHLFDARTVMITGQIEQKMATAVCARLLALAHVSSDPITVIVSSPGGHVESGDMIHDTIKFIDADVNMIGMGWVASAGALIYVAADKKRRFATPNTRFLLHEPSGGAGGQASDIEIQAREIIRMRDRLNKIFSDATGQPMDRIAEDTDRDFWMSIEEATKYGLVSKVITSKSELPK